MKKIIPLFAVLAVALVVLSGCSGKPSFSAQNKNNSQPPQVNNQRNGRMPDFGQPDRPADMRGVVTSIVGNEVTILKIANNRGRRASSTAETEGSSTVQNAPALSLGGPGGAPNSGPGGFAGGPGGMPNGEPWRNGSGTTDRAAMLANLKAMSTGQEKIVIPVGIKMMKTESDASGKPSVVEASLTDITADKMITVWMNAGVTDKKIADFILIN